ncbi:MAG TPA: pyrroloquinoline quinone biosynthesis peptide chaperone PqqD [Verrucomicrobiae bacterium]|jgi:pyrroloquinoline quinone biosynthesis protein D
MSEGTIPAAEKPRLAPKARLKWDAVREKHLLLFPEGVLVLNPTAHAVLALCDGQRNITEIAKLLQEQYQADNLETDVKEILLRLKEKRLVVLEP